MSSFLFLQPNNLFKQKLEHPQPQDEGRWRGK